MSGMIRYPEFNNQLLLSAFTSCSHGWTTSTLCSEDAPKEWKPSRGSPTPKSTQRQTNHTKTSTSSALLLSDNLVYRNSFLNSFFFGQSRCEKLCLDGGDQTGQDQLSLFFTASQSVIYKSNNGNPLVTNVRMRLVLPCLKKRWRCT